MDTAIQILIGLPAVLVAALNLVRAIVRLTPSDKDDAFIAKNESKIQKVIDFVTKLATIIPDAKKKK